MRKVLVAAIVVLSLASAAAAPRLIDRGLAERVGRWFSTLIVVPHSSGTRTGNVSSMRMPAATPPPDAIALNGSAPLSVPVNLAISGNIVGLPAGAPATAVVRVAGRAFTAPVANGLYSTTINALTDDDMVTVDLTSKRVHYRSIIGSFRSLKLHSGGDRKVDMREHPALQISPFTTATQWLVHVALGGRDAVSDDEYERATRAITSLDPSGTGDMNAALSRIASSLEKIAMGSAALPAGFKDGLSLVQDRAAFKQFTATAGIGKPDDAYPFIHAAPAPLKALSDVPATLLLTSAWIPGPTPSYASSLDIITADGAGVYSLHRQARHPAAAPHVTATFRGTINASGDLVLDALNNAGSEATDIDHRSKTWVRRIVLRRMSLGARDSLWASQETVETSNLDFPSQPPSQATTVELRAGFDLDKSSRADGWGASLVGDYTLTWPCAVPFPDSRYPLRYLLNSCEHARYLFSTNGAGSIDDFGPKVDDYMQPKPGAPGPSFNWTLTTRGRLQVKSAEATTWYWNIDAGDGVASVVVYLAKGVSAGTAGQSVAGLGRALRSTPFSVSSAQMVGKWTTSNSDEIAPARYPEVGARLEVRRASDGTSQYYTRSGGIASQPYPSNWKVAGGRVTDTRYMTQFANGATQWVQNCTTALPPDAVSCWPTMVRTFRPLARVGHRLYGLSDIYQDFNPRPADYTGPYEPERVSSYLETFDCFEGPCMTSFAAAMSAQSIPASPRLPGLGKRGGGVEAGRVRR